MEINLYNLFIYSKDKIIYSIFIIISIYFICNYSFSLLSRFKTLNKIKTKIFELNKLKEYDNQYIKNKQTQLNDINSKVMYQTNINNSLNNEYNEVNKMCNQIHSNYLLNINKISIDVPNNIKIQLQSYATEMIEIEKNRNKKEQELAEQEYINHKKAQQRQLELIRNAVAQRIQRQNNIQKQKQEAFNKKLEIRNKVVRAANKIKDCGRRKKFIIKMESIYNSHLSPQQLENMYRNYCRPPRIGRFGSCFGSDTMLKTSTGNKKIANLDIGENVLTWNSKINHFEYQPILYIRKHNNNVDKSKIFKITTNTDDEFIITNNHRLYTNYNETKKLEDLSKNEMLKTIDGESYIYKQEQYNDILLSPIVLNGNLVTSGGTVVSCWAGDDNNIKFMEKLMILASEYYKTHSVAETRDIMHIVYEECIYNNKNPDCIEPILKKLSLNNYVKYL
jgi:hypothetical protein